MHTVLMNMMLLMMCTESLVHAVEVLRIPRDDTLQRVHKIHCKAFRLAEVSVMLLRAWKLCLSHSLRVLD